MGQQHMFQNNGGQVIGLAEWTRTLQFTPSYIHDCSARSPFSLHCTRDMAIIIHTHNYVYTLYCICINLYYPIYMNFFSKRIHYCACKYVPIFQDGMHMGTCTHVFLLYFIYSCVIYIYHIIYIYNYIHT